ncbi:hypothetical protein DPMN_097368 [Dreissena polymorpha]|uniref:Uncharacterized protein n=1 Tax=Dreissena polymorpha TaxID=45954 RepID=A0A9D4R4P3_DREPO|nr:hypothetical protein DPMN_097368 [Dreissena polymorpha]
MRVYAVVNASVLRVVNQKCTLCGMRMNASVRRPWSMRVYAVVNGKCTPWSMRRVRRDNEKCTPWSMRMNAVVNESVRRPEKDRQKHDVYTRQTLNNTDTFWCISQQDQLTRQTRFDESANMTTNMTSKQDRHLTRQTRFDLTRQTRFGVSANMTRKQDRHGLVYQPTCPVKKTDTFWCISQHDLLTRQTRFDNKTDTFWCLSQHDQNGKRYEGEQYDDDDVDDYDDDDDKGQSSEEKPRNNLNTSFNVNLFITYGDHVRQFLAKNLSINKDWKHLCKAADEPVLSLGPLL